MRLLTPGLMSRDYARPSARVKHAGNLPRATVSLIAFLARFEKQKTPPLCGSGALCVLLAYLSCDCVSSMRPPTLVPGK